MKYIVKVLLFCPIFVSFSSEAQPLWQDASLSLLYGEDYAVGHKYRNVVTFEHAAGYGWGDHFFFIDRSDRAIEKPTVYAELTPRLSINNLLGNKVSDGIVKDFFIASRFEYAEITKEKNYLVPIQIAITH